MAKTANEELLDAMIRHQIYLMRLSNRVQREMLAVLNQSEGGMAEKIRSVLRDNKGLISSKDFRKLDKLLNSIAEIRTQAWQTASTGLYADMTALSYAEPQLMAGMMATTLPVVVGFNFPTGNRLKAIVTSSPFEGRVLKAWANRMREDDIARISNVIRAGMLANETNEQILRRVIGTSTMKGADGVTQLSRNQLDAVVKTATAHVASTARALFLEQNIDITLMEQLVATLDGRTTAICRALDKKKFLPGQGPRPPLHFRCRTIRVAAMGGDALVTRPSKPTTEKMLLREFTDGRNLQRVTSRDALPHGTKGAFDAFSRKRTRELVGPVPGTTSYQEWLKGQSIAFQDDILGKAKGKLFREGGLTLDKFVDRNGSELTLSELSKQHQQAFRDAGLDPSQY